MAYPYSVYNHHQKNISSIEFNVLSAKETYNMSVFKKLPNEEMNIGAEHDDLYDFNGIPKKYGLMDQRLGVIDMNKACDTCGFDVATCTGHFGHVKLTVPIINSIFFKHVRRILECVCLQCSKIPLSNRQKQSILSNSSNAKRMELTKNATKSVSTCNANNDGCGTPKTKIRLLKGKIPVLDSEYNDKHIELTPNDIHSIFSNISDEDCRVLGLNPEKTRPEMLIYTVLPITPISSRPSIKSGSSTAPMIDDLTRSLGKIIGYNSQLSKQIADNNDPRKSETGYHYLHYLISLYLTGETGDSKTDANLAKKSLVYRFKGKSGRIRQNLEGKRTNGTGRSVITPDPNIDQNCLGVPIKIAMNLTIPEMVTPKNIDILRKMVSNGNKIYPGANNVYLLSSRNINTKIQPIELNKNINVSISYGDVVCRHLIDDDIVLLNRQPSLHKSSMMGHRIRVLTNPDLLTFRLNPCIVNPYNADFDGDEMNIFVPQTKMSIIELSVLADARTQFISPKTSSVIITMIQDSVVGSFLMTTDIGIEGSSNTKNKNIYFSKNEAMNMLASTNLPIKRLIIDGDKFSGKDIYEHLIGDDINLTTSLLTINSGKIKRGYVEQGTLGSDHAGILHTTLDTSGQITTSTFVNNVQRVTNLYNAVRGFTIGIKDLLLEKTVLQQVQGLIVTDVLAIEHYITETENNFDITTEIVENIQMQMMTAIRDKVSALLQNEKNNFLVMSKNKGNSGAKGSIINYSQACACVGPAVLDGKLIARRLHSRSLPYFAKYDDTPRARGMIYSSYVQGLNLVEYYYDAMVGRSGVIDTAIKTAETGYIQRKIVKALEDVTINYYGRVTDSRGKIIQFAYGDAVFDTTKQSFTYSNILSKYDKSLYVMKGSEKFVKEFESILKDMRIQQMKCDIKPLHNVMPNRIPTPVNLPTFIYNMYAPQKPGKPPTIEHVIEKLDKFISNLKFIITNVNNALVKNDNDIYVRSHKFILYEYFAPKRVIDEYKMTKETFDKSIDTLFDAYNKAFVSPGENVGVIIAQSIGETLTQLSLNNIHKTGLNTMIGAPRIRELLACTEAVKHPKTIVYINDGVGNDRINRIRSNLSTTHIEDAVKFMELVYDPDGKHTNNMNQFYKRTSIVDMDVDMVLPWVYKMTFDREYMLTNELTLLDIKSKLADVWEKRVSHAKVNPKFKSIVDKITAFEIYSSNENDMSLDIHVRINFDSLHEDYLHTFYNHVLATLKIKGVKNIKNVLSTDVEGYITIEEDGNVKTDNVQVLVCDGINIRDVIQFRDIDYERLYCNDILTVQNIYGVEACRNVLISEFKNNFDVNINTQHFSLLADAMTHSGSPLSVGRHGLMRVIKDPIARASFEIPVSHLVDAALFNETDIMKSTSSRIISGSTFKSGTNAFHVSLNLDMLRNSEAITYAKSTNNDFTFLEQPSLFDSL